MALASCCTVVSKVDSGLTSDADGAVAVNEDATARGGDERLLLLLLRLDGLTKLFVVMAMLTDAANLDEASDKGRSSELRVLLRVVPNIVCGIRVMMVESADIKSSQYV